MSMSLMYLVSIILFARSLLILAMSMTKMPLEWALNAASSTPKARFRRH
jgi:hypothetical protein